MSRYVQFDLSDGSTVVIESDEPDGGVVKAGLGEVAERARETFEQAVENARNAALLYFTLDYITYKKINCFIAFFVAILYRIIADCDFRQRYSSPAKGLVFWHV